MTERLDKIISTAMNISRAESKNLIKKGLVSINGTVQKNSSVKADVGADEILCCGKKADYQKYVYIMMNKPKGVISASEGKNDKTVVDILPDDMKRKNLFPAGRLDKDTTGFMLITDDGAFAHRILSPKNHIPKTYIATLDKPFNDDIAVEFKNGIAIGDDKCMPALLEPVDGDYTKARVIIKQGMYHQIKRMFKKYSLNVLELERIKMGGLELDSSLKSGECRYLSQNEVKIIEFGNDI